MTRYSATAAEEADQVEQLWRGLNSRNLPCLVILDGAGLDAERLNVEEKWKL
jgi:hypothetical protein